MAFHHLLVANEEAMRMVLAVVAALSLFACLAGEAGAKTYAKKEAQA
jgi:hypothetical protein